jgi:hypothetical protein
MNITAATVLAARAAQRPDDLKRGRAILRDTPTDVVAAPVPGGHVVANLGATRSWLAELTPAEWFSVASTLYALIGREPIKSSARYAPERVLLGTLALELDSYARAAGEGDEGEVPASRPRLPGGMG